MVRAPALQAGGPRFEPATAHHLTPSSSTSPRFPWPPRTASLCPNCAEIPVRRFGCARIPAVLVSAAIHLRQCLPHHVALRVAVTLEYGRIPLPQHLRNKVIGNATGAEPRCEGVAQLVEREGRHGCTLQSRRPDLLERRDVRLAGLPAPGVGNRYSFPGVASICSWSARQARSEIGTSPTPSGVLESGT